MSAATEKLVSDPAARASLLDATAGALSALAASPLGFEAIAQQLPLHIVVLGRDLRVRWLNRIAADQLGQPDGAAVGAYWPAIAFAPTDRVDIYRRVLDGESVDIVGIEVQRAGDLQHIDGLCRPLRDADGEIVGILIVGQDVTDRRIAERALAESERRFRLLAEQSRDIVAVVNGSGRMQYVNRAIEPVLGYAAAEVIGALAFHVIHPDDVPWVSARLAELITSDEPGVTPLEYRVRHKDGSWRWIESLPTLLGDVPESRTVLTASRDVTERRRVEDALRLSEERYRLAIRAMNGVIYEWDTRSGRVLHTPGLGAWLGLAEDEVPGAIEEWLARIHPADRPTLVQLRHKLANEDQLETSYRVRTASGDYAWLWERSILVRDGDGQPHRVIGFIVNRTESSRTQRLLEATQRAARIGGWEQNFLTGQSYWTDQIFQLYDVAPDPAIPASKGTRRFFAPSSVPVIDAAIDAARTAGTPFDIETRMVGDTGRIWWARIVADVERDADGTPVRAYGAIQDITERKQTEIELRTNAQWLQVALATSQMSAWRLDLISGTIHTAARSANLGKMSIQPATLDALYAVMHPDDIPSVVAALGRVIDVQAPFTVEYRTRMVDGTWAWKSSSGQVELDEQGHPVALIGATQDVTDRKSAEVALRESERMLRQVTEHSTDSLTLVDRELRIRFTNRRIAGATAEEMEGRLLADVLPQDRIALVTACLQRVLRTGRPDSYALEHVSRIDGLRHYEFRVSPVMAGGEVSGLVINGSDVTGHILAERAIATQARMIDSMLEGVAVVDNARRVEITNPAFDRMFGYPRGALIGMEIDALSSALGDNETLWSTNGADSVANDAPQPIEFEGQRCDGSVFAVAGIVTHFEVAGGNHRLVVLQDVSERKALEREILEASSREQQRIGADLHDGLGQELTGIALMLKSVAGRLASEYPALLPEVDGITRLVSDAVESTRSLARGLSPVTLERRGLIDALQGLAMQARDAYRVQVEFRHRLPSGVELDQAVADHLYRIAQEALANAMRHGRANSVQITLTSRADRIRLQVADDGDGLPPDAIAAPGLGLKIMRYRARMVGGEVRFDSNGRGTRVTCECPVERRAVRSGAGDRRRGRSGDQDRRASRRRTDA